MSLTDALVSFAGGRGIVTSVDLTSVGNSAGTLTTLNSLTIPARTFQVNGDTLEFEYAGTGVSRAGNVLRVDYGSTLVCSATYMSAPGGGSGGWTFRGRIIRSGDSAQVAYGAFYADTLDSGLYPNAQVVTPSENMGLDTTITIKGNGTNANDFVIKSAWFALYKRTSV
jgi:hypothetical protein